MVIDQCKTSGSNQLFNCISLKMVITHSDVSAVAKKIHFVQNLLLMK